MVHPFIKRKYPSLLYFLKIHIRDPYKRSIADDESTHWSNAWDTYKNSRRDVWNMGNDLSVPDAFKTTCKNRLNLEVESKDSREYLDFLSYCTRNTLMREFIEEKNPDRELIATGQGSSQDWQNAWKTYKSDHRNQDQSDGTNVWSLSDWGTRKSEQNAPDTFMNRCSENANSSSRDVTVYFDTVKFCTKSKTQLS